MPKVAPALDADDHDRFVVQPRRPANDGGVVGKEAVAVQLGEVSEHPLDVIERIGAMRVPRNLHLLPRAEIGVDFSALLRGLRLELAHALIQIQAIGLGLFF